MDAREMKIKAAAAALAHVENGMRLGIGTGSTAEEFVRLLAEKVADGFRVEGVPTSERTARLCVELRCPSKSTYSAWSRPASPSKKRRRNSAFQAVSTFVNPATGISPRMVDTTLSTHLLAAFLMQRRFQAS
jgi:hypothetical protein